MLVFWGILLALPIVSYLWVKWQLSRCNRTDELPGSGFALAEHLIQRYQLEGVKVEASPLPDHYDPVRKCIVLNERWAHRRTVTSAAIAVHELGHAVQDHLGEPEFKRHSWVMRSTFWIQRLSQIAFLGLLPFSWIPLVLKLTVLLLLVSTVLSVLLHAAALPIELDASFKKAMPILREGEYLTPRQRRQAWWVLAAAAFTYITSAVWDILNFRLLMLLIRR